MNNRAINGTATTPRESLVELLGYIANNSAAMVHDEIELVIQGIRENVRAARSGIVIVAIGGIVGFAAFMSFCAALTMGLAYYMPAVIAAIVSGLVLALIGIAIVLIGYNKLVKSMADNNGAYEDDENG